MNAPDLVLDAVLRELNDFTSYVSLYLLPTATGSGSFVLPVQSGGLQVDPEQLEALRRRLTRGRPGRAIVTADQTLIRTVLPEPAASPNLVLVPILIGDTIVGSLNVGADEQPTTHLIDDLRARADRIGAALTPVPDRSAHRRDLQLNLINRLGRQDVWQMELTLFWICLSCPYEKDSITTTCRSLCWTKTVQRFASRHMPARIEGACPEGIVRISGMAFSGGWSGTGRCGWRTMCRRKLNL